ncbi:probable N-acetylglucosaminyl-phosphatidylinositol de-N-acetylase isoform X5 [Diospyros lotus]|nr:probable N-acetylglucosaminyl-phosphatidylinositol de-N-acetylase isoform X5 [Diospyros lotus]
MAWFMVIVSVFVLWVASLCKILYSSYSSSKATFLSDGGGGLGQKNVLLVIAHPDDESMFFTPTINYLMSRRHNLRMLCISTGDADGMGSIRKEELYKASAILKVPLQQVKILDHPHLQDGFGKVWNLNLLANIIEEEILSHATDLIITFDDYGVSGHCNHRDVNHGIRKLLLNNTKRDVEAWELIQLLLYLQILRLFSSSAQHCRVFWLHVYGQG